MTCDLAPGVCSLTDDALYAFHQVLTRVGREEGAGAGMARGAGKGRRRCGVWRRAGSGQACWDSGTGSGVGPVSISKTWPCLHPARTALPAQTQHISASFYDLA